jgi:uncharacterized membrane protein
MSQIPFPSGCAIVLAYWLVEVNPTSVGPVTIVNAHKPTTRTNRRNKQVNEFATVNRKQKRAVDVRVLHWLA